MGLRLFMNKRIRKLFYLLAGSVAIMILLWMYYSPSIGNKSTPEENANGFGKCTSEFTIRETIIGTLCWNEKYNIYTTMEGKGIIWAYESDPSKIADIIRMGFASISCMNDNFLELVILSKSSFQKLIRKINPGFELLNEEHQSRYVMMSVLYEFGGIFVQKYTAAIQPFTRLFTQLAEYEFIYENFANYDDTYCAGTYGPIRYHNLVTSTFLEKANDLIDTTYQSLKESEVSKKPYPLEPRVFDKLIMRTHRDYLTSNDNKKVLIFKKFPQFESLDKSCIKERNGDHPSLHDPLNEYVFFETEVHNFRNGLNDEFIHQASWTMLLSDRFEHLVADLVKFSFWRCKKEIFPSTTDKSWVTSRLEKIPVKLVLMGQNRTHHEWNSEIMEMWIQKYMSQFSQDHKIA